MAEGAQFLMMSVNLQSLEFTNRKMVKIKSFRFFQLVDPHNPTVQELGRRLGVCSDKHTQACRLG